MGYDMTWRKKDASEEAAVAAAREAMNAAADERDALPDAERGTMNMDWMREHGDPDDPRAWDGRSERYATAQAKVSAAQAAWDSAEASYFRLNIFGMGRWREVMYDLGMVFDAPEQPEWPEIESYGITWDDVERVESPEFFTDEPPVDAETAEKARRYIAKRDELLAWHGPEVPGIPAHKFGSNDGWIVLPAECEAALRIYAAKLEEIGQDAMHNFIDNKIGNRGRWGQWLAYLI